MAFEKVTEKPSLYDDLEKKSIKELLVRINNEDQKVPIAVQKQFRKLKNWWKVLFNV